MAFNGRTIFPFKVGALEISVVDSVSSLVVDFRHVLLLMGADVIGLCGCEVEGSDDRTAVVDGVKANAAAGECAAELIRRAAESRDAVFIIVVGGALMLLLCY
eukprot:scaffold4209_cov121-Skeletonema_dohrnii-CCMP3373.AAC.3